MMLHSLNCLPFCLIYKVLGLYDDPEGYTQHLQQRLTGKPLRSRHFQKRFNFLKKIYRTLSCFVIDTDNSPSTWRFIDFRWFSFYLQEDKEAMFDVYDTLLGVIKVATGVLSTLQVCLVDLR